MTPEDRMDAHEQWLLDHDREMTAIRAILRQIGEVQLRQGEVMVEIAQHVARLLDKDQGGAQ